MARTVVDDAADLLERDREIPGDARHHRIGVTVGDHRRREVVAVLVDQALAVAHQKALALQTLVEELRVHGVSARQGGIVDLHPLDIVEIQSGGRGIRLDAILPPDQDRGTEALRHERNRGAHHLLLLALGEDDSLGEAPRPLHHTLQGPGDRVAPGRELRLVGVEIDDRSPCHAAVHCGASDGGRNGVDQTRIERNRDDVIAPEPRPAPLVGCRHLVRHVLAREVRERMDRRNLHFHVDRRGAGIEGTPEDVWKTKNVVDLVGVVRTPGRHDGIVADRVRLLRRDLRIRIGHSEDDRVRRHRPDHIGGERTLRGQAEEDVRPVHGVGQRAFAGLDRMGRLPLVHALGAAAVDDTLGVAKQHILGREAHRLDEVEAGDAGGPCPVADELGLANVPAGELDGVQHPGRGNDRGAVLIVMEHRNVHELAQPLFDDETLGSLDVLEIDAAEGRAEISDAGNEGVGVLRVDLEVDRVDVGEALEQHRFAFHHRF